MSEKFLALPASPAAPQEVPFAYTRVTLSKQDYIQLKWEAHYWQAEWQRARVREPYLSGKLSSQRELSN